MPKYFAFLLILLLCSISCNERTAFNTFKELPNGNWHSTDTLVFTLKDLGAKNKHLYFNIRNNDFYPFSNLFLIASLENDNGMVVVDTLEYQMALPNGTWLGKGMGSTKEHKLWYKQNIALQDTAVYTLKITHAMRKVGAANGLQTLKGITDFGVEVENVP